MASRRGQGSDPKTQKSLKRLRKNTEYGALAYSLTRALRSTEYLRQLDSVSADMKLIRSTEYLRNIDQGGCRTMIQTRTREKSIAQPRQPLMWRFQPRHFNQSQAGSVAEAKAWRLELLSLNTNLHHSTNFRSLIRSSDGAHAFSSLYWHAHS